jgi:squalene-hopene/tetraprenyl-beta-curcumene cyclase
MRQRVLSSIALFTASVTVITCVSVHRQATVSASESWNASAAAHHLDARQTWWMNWPKAQRDHETACVSCHTTLPYAIARSSMRQTLGESGPSATEETMLKYVSKRVNQWDEMEPFYNDAKSGPRKSIESRGTESVLNALILARYDTDSEKMSELTRKAFQSMWAAQLTEGTQAGAWNWLNFHNAPWESNESQYYGATLGALAVGFAPGEYRKSPGIQGNLKALRAYLTNNYEAQPLVNRIVLLWASTRVDGLLTDAQRHTLMMDICSHQARDGGWTMATMGDWKRRDKTEIDPRSDGYATGLVVYAMKEAGYPQDKPEMKRAIEWLVTNQSPTDGLWPAYSLNKERDPASDVGQFMTDAATSYSVLALEAVRR